MSHRRSPPGRQARGSSARLRSARRGRPPAPLPDYSCIHELAGQQVAFGAGPGSLHGRTAEEHGVHSLHVAPGGVLAGSEALLHPSDAGVGKASPGHPYKGYLRGAHFDPQSQRAQMRVHLHEAPASRSTRLVEKSSHRVEEQPIRVSEKCRDEFRCAGIWSITGGGVAGVGRAEEVERSRDRRPRRSDLRRRTKPARRHRSSPG